MQTIESIIFLPDVNNLLVTYLTPNDLQNLSRCNHFMSYLGEKVGGTEIKTSNFLSFHRVISPHQNISDYSKILRDLNYSFLCKNCFVRYHDIMQRYESLAEEYFPSLPILSAQVLPSDYFYLRYINDTKKWGLFTRKLIKPRSYICIYFGELINQRTMQERYRTSYDQQGWNYVLSIHEHSAPPPTNNDNEKTSFVLHLNVDATSVGSIARFVNHSCAANCEIILYRQSKQQHTDIIGIPVFQSNRFIYPHEEISINYGAQHLHHHHQQQQEEEGEHHWDDNNEENEDGNEARKRKKVRRRQRICDCGSLCCQGYLPNL